MKPKFHHSRTPFFLSITIAMVAAGGLCQAAINTWKVQSGTWGTSSSWTAAPLATDDAIFSDPTVGGLPVTVTLDGNKTVNTMTFQSVGTTLLTGGTSNRNIPLAAGITVQSGAGAVTISIATNASGITMTADQTWTNDGTLSITNTVKPVSPATPTLTLTGTGVTDISGNITGALSILKAGSGTLTFSGTGNTYTGTLTVKQGILSIGTINGNDSNGSFGKSTTPVTLGDTGVTGTLSYTGATASSTKTFALAADGTGAFNVTNSETTLTLSGAIDGSGGLKKTGPGTLILSTSKTYTGSTEVTGGTLRINGTTGAVSVTSGALLVNGTAGAVSLSATGTLGGSGGTVTGAVSMVSGSTVAPGTTSSTGTLNTTGNLAFVPGAIFDTDIITDSSSADRLNVDGNLNLAGATLTAENLGSVAPSSSQAFTIATYTGTLSGTFNGLPEGAAVPIGGKNFILKYADGGNNITLTAPEVVGTPYDSWAAANITNINGLADATPTGNPDGDGSNNLAEYAFNGDPLDGSDNGQIYVFNADSDFDLDTDKELILTIAVIKGAPAFASSPSPTSTMNGITYTIEGSTTLVSFNSVVNVVPTPVTTNLPSAGPDYEYRSFSLAGSNGLAGKGFLRAKATK